MYTTLPGHRHKQQQLLQRRRTNNDEIHTEAKQVVDDSVDRH